MSTDQLSVKMDYIHTIADVLLSIIDEDPKAQVLTQIIMDLSLLPN